MSAERARDDTAQQMPCLSFGRARYHCEGLDFSLPYPLGKYRR